MPARERQHGIADGVLARVQDPLAARAGRDVFHPGPAFKPARIFAQGRDVARHQAPPPARVGQVARPFVPVRDRGTRLGLSQPVSSKPGCSQPWGTSPPSTVFGRPDPIVAVTHRHRGGPVRRIRLHAPARSAPVARRTSPPWACASSTNAPCSCISAIGAGRAPVGQDGGGQDVPSGTDGHSHRSHRCSAGRPTVPGRARFYRPSRNSTYRLSAETCRRSVAAAPTSNDPSEAPDGEIRIARVGRSKSTWLGRMGCLSLESLESFRKESSCRHSTRPPK